MKISTLGRLIVALAAMLFVGVGLAFWAAPDQSAQRFGLEASSAAGRVSLRADYGGLFVGLALLCGVAAFTRRRLWAAAAATTLSAIVIGRLIGWIGNGGAAGDVVELAIELGVLAALALTVQSGPAEPVRLRRSLSRPAMVAAGLVLTAAVGVSATMLSPAAQQAIFDRVAGELTATVNTAPLVDDALRIAVCGSSAPLPSARRGKACVAVFAGGKFYIVDVGPESVENLVLWGIPLSSVGGVFLTHFHSDHIGDLGELNLQTWAGGRPTPLAVYGGPGVERVVDGFNAAYRMDQGYRTAHHTERLMPSSTWAMEAHPVELDGAPTAAKDRTGLVFDRDGLKVTAIEVDHAPIAPAYAYRFDYKGRSVVVSGDLKFHPPLAKAAAGVDVLVSEAIATQMTRSLGTGAHRAGRDRTAAIMHDIEDYHISPEQAAQIANEARARLLVYYHLLPSPDGFLARQLFTQGVAAARKGDWTIADDGSLYTLPIGSTTVEIDRMSGAPR